MNLRASQPDRRIHAGGKARLHCCRRHCCSGRRRTPAADTSPDRAPYSGRRRAILLDIGHLDRAGDHRPLLRQRTPAAASPARTAPGSIQRPRRTPPAATFWDCRAASAKQFGQLIEAEQRAEHDRKRDRQADAEAAPPALRRVALQHSLARMPRIVIDGDGRAGRIFRDGLGDCRNCRGPRRC